MKWWFKHTAQKMKFSIKDYVSSYDQIRIYTPWKCQKTLVFCRFQGV